MLILFLDMDGVVNSNQLVREWLDAENAKLREKHPKWSAQKLIGTSQKNFLKEFNDYTELIFPVLAERITRIVRETDCKIVWSSSWRAINKYKRISNAREMFNKRGLPGDALIGYTCDSRGLYMRGIEIDSWLKAHKEVTRAVIVDDLEEAGIGCPDAKFFKTNEEYGITEEITNNIIDYLKGGNK